jgi:hypothetical protein
MINSTPEKVNVEVDRMRLGCDGSLSSRVSGVNDLVSGATSTVSFSHLNCNAVILFEMSSAVIEHVVLVGFAVH